MVCFGFDGDRNRRLKSGCFERSSPALQQILLQLFRDQKPMEIDHRLYEFGSLEYHVQSSASDPPNVNLSISTPILSPRTLVSQGLCPDTILKVKGKSPNVVDILHPARDGYQLTLQLKLAHIPLGKEGVKVIKEIAAVSSVILSSQLKEMLRDFSSYNASERTYKPIKCAYHPREPLFVIRQLQKITVVFPMRFRETTDVVIATSFFQELMDIGSSEVFAKAPPCTWLPIPPPELRGELMEDLSTNGDIFSRNVDDKRLDDTVWNLLNFHTYVKSYIKSTKGFIQRKMRRRLEDMVKILHQADLDEDDQEQQVRGMSWIE